MIIRGFKIGRMQLMVNGCTPHINGISPCYRRVMIMIAVWHTVRPGQHVAGRRSAVRTSPDFQWRMTDFIYGRGRMRIVRRRALFIMHSLVGWGSKAMLVTIRFRLIFQSLLTLLVTLLSILRDGYLWW